MKALKRVICEYFKIDKKRENFEISNVVMDSKKVQKNSLFFAINSGNDYVQEALDKEASLVICDNSDIKDARVLKVKNSIEIMQELAKIYRERLKIRVVGVTGSEGKTTTKDLVYSVLKEKFRTYKSEGNYNNRIGLPFSILQLRECDEIAILEMGMSSLGEIDRLAQISRPDYAIITNIGDSHLEYLKNRENVFKAKTELLKYIDKKCCIVYGDDFYLKNIDNVIKVGFGKENSYILANLVEEYKKTEFCLNDEIYTIALNGIHNVINSSFSVVIGKLLGMNYSEIKKGLQSAEITKMRFEKIEKKGNIYINDAYNASPESMKAALRTFNTLPTNRKKVVILGDMLEMGENENRFHKEILNFMKEYNFYRVFVFGERMKRALDELGDVEIEYFENKNRLKERLQSEVDLIILLKGSRGMRLEEII